MEIKAESVAISIPADAYAAIVIEYHNVARIKESSPAYLGPLDCYYDE